MKKKIQNRYSITESNILTVANNQRILNHFLFGKDTEFDSIDITQRPKTYFPHRTQTSFAYNFGKDLHLELDNIRIEIDLTIEFQGTIGVFDGKMASLIVLQFVKSITHFGICARKEEDKY